MPVNRYKQHDGVQSAQEEAVRKRYPTLSFKPAALLYTRRYLPDFDLGERDGYRCVLELKEYMALQDVAKYTAVCDFNPAVRIYFLIERAQPGVLKRLNAHPQITAVHGTHTIPPQWLEGSTAPAATWQPPSARELGRRT